MAAFAAIQVACLGQTSRPDAAAAHEYDEPVALGRVADARITEVSGIAASRRYPGLFYVHNDSGDRARVFVLDSAARTRAVVQLRGVTAEDCEDMSIAPGATPGTWDVCLADIGDNSTRRAYVTIYRFGEPDLPAAGAAEQARAAQPRDAPLVEVDALTSRWSYADGPADAEAFCVDPRAGDGYVLTKRLDGRTFVYKLAAPWDGTRADAPSEVRIATRVATVALPGGRGLPQAVTAADISPDGTRLAVRCYIGGWELTRAAPAGADAAAREFESIFASAPEALPLPLDRQPEALGYTADGRGLVTMAEGRTPVLWELREAGAPDTRPAPKPD
ncbi:MAG: hypothetical protein AB1716_09895 [Planctomycetota bacterium]